MKTNSLILLAATTAISFNVAAKTTPVNSSEPVTDQVIAEQRATLADNTKNKGFGPQSPRNLNTIQGENRVLFNAAPPYSEMNLCNIHFHKNAEHLGGEFSEYAGNGDGKGHASGYRYSGALTKAELAPIAGDICVSQNGSLNAGDTIEVHYVYSTAQVAPGPTLGACFNEAIKNPQLRVEAQVYVLVNDSQAQDFAELTDISQQNGKFQVLNLPVSTGKSVQYAGSTTGPSYNENGSPFQVSWGVRPQVAKVNVASVGEWCNDNVFEEDYAHGVRNLVTNPDLLSPITP
ncbi:MULTISPECIES: delta-class carbonic anhydrase [Oceanisphaera]|uniref:Delta-class carbonic anhydrase n=1 Tax=Oceanisphaera ostreae TaxID=914151 RepID=A0ABW3KGW0_9GAMM